MSLIEDRLQQVDPPFQLSPHSMRKSSNEPRPVRTRSSRGGNKAQVMSHFDALSRLTFEDQRSIRPTFEYQRRVNL